MASTWASVVFEKAGFAKERVVTCHGDMHHLQCTNRDCRAEEGQGSVWSAECIPSGLGHHIDAGSLRFMDATMLEAAFFRCPRCGKLARPNVWFCSDRNHVFWQEESDRRAAYNSWLRSLQQEGKRVVVIECGGGMDIPTVRCEGEDAVEEAGEGSLLVRFNPTDGRVPAERAVGLPFGAREGLERLDAALSARRGAASGHTLTVAGRGTGAAVGRVGASSARRASPAAAPAPAGRGHRRPSPSPGRPPQPRALR